MTNGDKSSGSILTWILGSIASIASVAAFGTGALYVGSGDDPGDVAKAQRQSTQQVTLLEQEEKARELRVHGPLFDFFGIAPYLSKNKTGETKPPVDDAKSSADDAEEISRLKDALEKHLHDYEIQFMVVTVADPIDSGENYMFDQQIDAIQKALTVDPADPWLYSGAYLPWQAYRNRSAMDSKITLVRSEHWYQDEPGLLLFRKEVREAKNELKDTNSAGNKTERKGLLLVYLVGEVPTLGIQRDAFEHAMREIVHLSNKGKTPYVGKEQESKKIRVIGPTFTGSAFSLRESLLEFRKGNPHVSGEHGETPNDEKLFMKHCLLTLTCGGATAVPQGYFKDIPHCDYLGSTVCSFHETKNALDELVGRQKIAWLVESGTQFGTQFGAPSGVSQEPNEYVFHFPLEISRVRKSFEQKRAIERQQMLALNSLGTSSRLPFDIDEEAHDVPVPQTPNVTTPEAELILVKMLREIKNLGINYVAVQSTDIRDTIFLADAIKMYCPGAQLLIPESDLLLAHPEYSDSLLGGIAASSYPLFASAIIASQEPTEPIQLMSSQIGYGVYNAVRLQRLLAQTRLIRDGLAQGYTPPGEVISSPNFLAGFRTDCVGPSETQHVYLTEPKIWLHKIGNQVFVPLGPPKRYPRTGLQTETISVQYKSNLLRERSENVRSYRQLFAPILILLAFVLGIALNWRSWEKEDSPFCKLFLLSPICIAIVYAVFAVTNWLCQNSDQYALFNGVSVLLPLVLACAAIGSMLLAHRNRMEFHIIFPRATKFVLEGKVPADALVHDGPVHTTLITANKETPENVTMENSESASERKKSESDKIETKKSFDLVAFMEYACAIAILLVFTYVLWWEESAIVDSGYLWCNYLCLSVVKILLLIVVVAWLATMFAGIRRIRHQVQRMHLANGNSPPFSHFGLCLDTHDLSKWHQVGLRGVQRLIFGAKPISGNPEKVPQKLFDIHCELRGLRCIYQALLLGSFFMFLSVASYPFTTGYLLRQFATVAVVGSLAFCMWSYWKLERNEELSKLVGTKPEEIAWNSDTLGFMIRTSVPTVAILLIQVIPGSWPSLGQILGPLLHSGK